MRYLTKEWYNLCQLTGLHFGLRSHKGTSRFSEKLYQRLYERKEKEYIEMKKEVYNLNPRVLLDTYGEEFVRADKFFSGKEIKEEDTVIIRNQKEIAENIQKLIEEYDTREPFNEKIAKLEFKKDQELTLRELKEKIPSHIYSQIADPRIFALGYCTSEIRKELKEISEHHKASINNVLNEYSKVQKNQDIPINLLNNFTFHDCEIKSIYCDSNIVIILNNSYGFTKYNKIIFKDAKIIKKDKFIEGSVWLYEELYRTETGYEAHILFTSDSVYELTIECNDIIIEKS